MRLKYRLWEEGNNFFFQVVWMDGRFIRTEYDSYEAYREFPCRNGFRVNSHKGPQLDLDNSIIWLRGLSSKFDQVSIVVDRSNRVTLEQIHQALRDWSINWNGWYLEHSGFHQYDSFDYSDEKFEEERTTVGLPTKPPFPIPILTV